MPTHEIEDFNLQDPKQQVSTNWSAVVVVTLFLVSLTYFGMIRPARDQIRMLRLQVDGLSDQIAQLQGQGESADRTVSLLESLAAQGERAHSAQAALEQIDALHQEFSQRVEQVAARTVSLEKLNETEARLRSQQALLSQAAEGLSQTERLRSEVIDVRRDALQASQSLEAVRNLQAGMSQSLARLIDSFQVVDRMEALLLKLAEADQLAERARSTTDAMIATQATLADQQDSTVAAEKNLEQLIALQRQLSSQAGTIAESQLRLQQLFDLKDQVVAETGNLPAAIDTLGLMVDMNDAYRNIQPTLRKIETLMTSLILLEPTLERIASSVQPALDEANVSMIDGSGLRLVLRELLERHTAAMAEANQPDLGEQEVASLPSEDQGAK